MHYRLIVSFLVGGIFSLLFLTKPDLVERLSLKVEDAKWSFRQLVGAEQKPSQAVVVVAIDEKSVNELGRWPWSRKTLAQLVRKLSPAKVVAFDIVLSEAESREADRDLARAIRESGNVILGFFFRKNSTQSIPEHSISLLRESEFLRFELTSEKVGLAEYSHAEIVLPEFLRTAVAVGFLNAQPDPDAVYRKYPVAYLFKGSLFLPLALQSLRFFKGKDFKMTLSEKGIESLEFDGKQIPLYEGRFYRINFYDPKRIKTVSAVDLIKGRIKPEMLKGKAVFVGSTEAGIFDLRPTPVDPTMPGVYLHAFVFSNFHKNHHIKFSSSVDLLLILSTALFPLLISTLKSFPIRLTYYLLFLFGYILLSLTAFSFLSYDISLFYPTLALITSAVSQESLRLLVAERETRKLKRAFSSYVSPQILEIIIRNPDKLRLGGEKRTVTVLFSDIRGFTALSERLEPEKLVKLLNEFLTPMTDIILSNGGTLDKYIGDAIMAIFNAPVEVKNHADRACISALNMVKVLEEMNPRFKNSFGVELEVGIGINTGEAVVGNMGSHQRFDYTAIGDTVNLASRLEGLNKLYGTRIILSEHTVKSLKGFFLTRKLDRVVVKGKTRPVEIYELMEDTPQNRNSKEVFEKALNLYFEGKFEEAITLFREIGDAPSKVFLKRCRYLIKNPPQSWNGIYTAEEK